MTANKYWFYFAVLADPSDAERRAARVSDIE